MAKDWTGNKKSTHNTFVTLGSSNHSDGDREENDFYATHPSAVEMLCDLETFNKNILEPCCGQGHISEVLISRGYNVISHDLVNRGYGEGGHNFLDRTEPFDGDVITNPPYKYALEFVNKSLELIPVGNKVVMFLKIQFLEGKSRALFFEKHPPKIVYVSSMRLPCALGGDFIKYGNSTAICYCWYIWEKEFTGETTLKWFNKGDKKIETVKDDINNLF